MPLQITCNNSLYMKNINCKVIKVNNMHLLRMHAQVILILDTDNLRNRMQQQKYIHVTYHGYPFCFYEGHSESFPHHISFLCKKF
jgi:hypothetical protein